MPGTFVWIDLISPKVFIHELGHNMGLPHANSCLSTFTYSLIDKCKHFEYGDALDPMGRGNSDNATFGPAYLKLIGWLPASHWTSWNGTTATFDLSTTDSTTGGLRGIRIDGRGSLLSDAPGEFWIQFSKPTERPNMAGVYLTLTPTKEHIARAVDIPWMADTGPGLFTWLCDISPTSFPDGAYSFKPKVPWLDPLGRFSITVNSIGTTASVTISPIGKLPSEISQSAATPAIGPSGEMSGAIEISWNSIRPLHDAPSGEAIVVEARVSGSSVGCSALVFVRTCTIPSAPRKTDLVITITPRNYSGIGPSITRNVSAIPMSRPQGILKVVPGATTADVSIFDLNDGGSPITSISAISTDKGSSCNLNGNTCRLNGLLPGTRYSISTKVTNALGSTVLTGEFRASEQMPGVPDYTVQKNGNTYTVTVKPKPIDINNLTGLGHYCGDKPTFENTTVHPWNASLEKLTWTLPLDSQKCWVIAITPKGRVGTTIVVPPTPTLPSSPIIIASTSRRHSVGMMFVKWKVIDKNTGQAIDGLRIVVSGIKGRMCYISSSSSFSSSGTCHFYALSRSKKYQVKISAPGVTSITLRGR